MQFFTFIISQKSACHIYNIMNVSVRPQPFGVAPTASKIKRPRCTSGYDTVRATTKSNAFKLVDSSIIDDILLIIIITMPTAHKSALSRAVCTVGHRVEEKVLHFNFYIPTMFIFHIMQKYLYLSITTATLNVFNEPSQPYGN